MSIITDIVAGDVVACGRQVMIVIGRSAQALVACPLVSVDEPRHRADGDLDWRDLLQAGLDRCRMRARGVPCRRDVRRAVRIGNVPERVWTAVRERALRELAQRVDEMPRSRPKRETIVSVRENAARRRVQLASSGGGMLQAS